MILPPIDPERFAAEWEADQDVLAKMRADGDRSEMPRLVDVSFRGPPAALEKLADAAENFAFEVLEIETSDDGDPWLFIEREQTTDDASIKSLTTLCLQFEAAFGVEYDGWGCVAQNGQPS